MTDMETKPTLEKTEGGDSTAAFTPPPYPTDPAFMQQPPAYVAPPYPYDPTVNPPGGDVPPPAYVAPPYPYGPTVYPPGAPGGDDPLPAQNVTTAGSAAGDQECGTGAPEFVTSSFDDKTVRKAFIRKVFSVVTVQLLVTFSIVCVFTFSETVRKAVQDEIWIYLSSYIIFMVVALALSFSSSLCRKHPWNFIALSVVTLSLSFMVGTVASYHDTTAVIIAMGSTLVISFSIIIFSAQTRVDFTVCNGILIVLAVDLLMFGFFSTFYYSNVLQIVYGSLGALLYALFLAVDCQMVLGRQKYSLSPEEYVFAALVIYLDIIAIFLYILMILGGSSKS
ncbi:protein lifeguard 1 [Hemibagrus wyckioides]|uniref:protein lifeguard 1 n=1 Tax=Hemibagrus wyckioides TaxID=337641 RepID=UPI00266CF597|nr:protein lifeguard 1 [Hemibagrus wyckioides]XP_058241445.1 protein lifeguard 1 [Hemibagrus wyckioides]